MSAKTLATIIGVAFVATGALGFFENPLIYHTDAIFHVDSVHNWFHIISGALFLLVAIAAPGFARTFMFIFGIAYLGVGILGLTQIGSDGMTQLLGFLHVNGNDNYLHIGLGIAIILCGLIAGKRTTTTARTGNY
jgi:hypothetical protein